MPYYYFFKSSFKWCEILSVMKQRAIKENHNYHSHEVLELVTVLTYYRQSSKLIRQKRIFDLYCKRMRPLIKAFLVVIVKQGSNKKPIIKVHPIENLR